MFNNDIFSRVANSVSKLSPIMTPLSRGQSVARNTISNSYSRQKTPALVTGPAPRKAFSEVLPFEKVFNDRLVTGLAESQINPEIDRQRFAEMANLGRGLASSGGWMSGTGAKARSDLLSGIERARKEQVGAFTDTIKNNLTDWYNRQYQQYNQNPSAYVMPQVPSMNDYLAQNIGAANAYNAAVNIPTRTVNPFLF